MAGMLPGVECARRRRIHQGGSTDSSSGSRRSSFCLYTATHKTHFSTNSTQRNGLNKDSHDEGLGDIAREAKKRLDERLRSTKEIDRCGISENGGKRRGGCKGPDLTTAGNVQTQVFYAKNRGSKRFNWSKFGSKESQQEGECAVCMEEFRMGEALVQLPCTHRFHWNCVVPWLECSSHCPCCRMTISPS